MNDERERLRTELLTPVTDERYQEWLREQGRRLSSSELRQDATKAAAQHLALYARCFPDRRYL